MLLNVLIVADGDVPARPVVDRLLGGRMPDLVIAADGGALKARVLGFEPALVVGDTDSLSAADVDRLRADGIDVLVHPRAKDESDTELAVREALARNPRSLLLVGGFGGGRIEHTVANILLL